MKTVTFSSSLAKDVALSLATDYKCVSYFNTLEPGKHPNTPEEGWTQMTKKGKKTPTTESAVDETVKPTTSETTTTVPTPKLIEPATLTLIQPSTSAKKSKRKTKKKKYTRTAWRDGDLHKLKELERQWGNQSQKILYSIQHPHRI